MQQGCDYNFNQSDQPEHFFTIKIEPEQKLDIHGRLDGGPFPWATKRHPPPRTTTIPMEARRWLPSVGTSDTRA
jgi:hypothetical protein